MPVVSNTSPILNLAIIDYLSLLQQQFGAVHVPSIVLQELRIDEELPGSQAIRQALQVGWLQVVAIEDDSLVRALKTRLDAGEAACIALAVQMQADWTLIDEREGRRVAKSLGLQVTGLLGILLRAVQRGELSSLEETLVVLQEKAGFYIAPQLVSNLLRKTTGNRN